MKTYQIPLKDGDEGVKDTVKLMWQYINEWKNKPQTKDLINKLKRNNDFETAKAIFNYVVQNVQYKYDPQGIELVKSIKHTIFGNMRWGDCDDLTVALNTLLEAAGIHTAIKTIAWRPGNRNFSHVYTIATIDGKIYPLDPTMKAKGFNNEVKYHRMKVWNNGY